jgi:hypothetical protein
VNLKDALAEEKDLARGPQCTVGQILSSMSEDDRATLQQAFINRSVTWATLSRALSKVGAKASTAALSRHARRNCICE